MTEEKKNKKWLTCVIPLVLVACFMLFFFVAKFVWKNAGALITGDETVSLSPTTEALDKTVPYEAVVQILALYEENGELVIGWTGSGSIISPEGLILTNAHVVLPDRYFNVDALAVAITLSDDQPPEPLYFSEVLQADEALDIAVIQITTDIDGNPVEVGTLNLPYVALGDSNELSLGDRITILGYPSIGGETITLTTGEVSGFTAESPYGKRAFIKTSATIAGGNSGGLAADSNGRLIGIPTQLGYGGGDQFVDCRVLEDTNRDGVVDEKDNCVPTGGFINSLRPISLALPYIEAAKNGQTSIQYIEAQVIEEDLEVTDLVLFEDDFSDPSSGWGAMDLDSGSTHYRDGQLQIEVISDQYIIWATPEKSFNSVIISVSATVLQSVGDGEFGVLCGYQDVDNFYGLEISEDGYYSIWKYVEGEYETLVDWEYSSRVHDGQGNYTIAVLCDNQTLALAANGEVLAEVSDPAFRYGDIGLIAGTLDQGGLLVGFDDLVVTDN